MQRPMARMLRAASGRMSLHMPGHQGKAPFGEMPAYRWDTTELPVTDDLYHAKGAIARAEELGAQIEYRQRVDRILVRDGGVYGVRTERGDEILSDHVICSAYPNRCYTSMIEPANAVPAAALNE